MQESEGEANDFEEWDNMLEEGNYMEG